MINSPFDWKAKPSSLSKDKEFNGINHRKSIVASNRMNHSPVSLPGGSKNLPLQMMRKPK